MPTTTGFFQTENGSKYLQQLCKHFGHKVETSFDPHKGWVAFDMGTAHMTAKEEGLTVTATVKDQDAVRVMHDVIDRHLEKFAFREADKKMVWTVD